MVEIRYTVVGIDWNEFIEVVLSIKEAVHNEECKRAIKWSNSNDLELCFFSADIYNGMSTHNPQELWQTLSLEIKLELFMALPSNGWQHSPFDPNSTSKWPSSSKHKTTPGVNDCTVIAISKQKANQCFGNRIEFKIVLDELICKILFFEN